MKIHALEIGQVQITQTWRHGRGEGLARLFHTLFDKQFTDWLPIYAWLIEHPEGLILIDSGIPADANRRRWFPPTMPLIQRAARFKIDPGQEVGPQLLKLGYQPTDIRWVLMTHLHQDHDGGLASFPEAEILVSRSEWAAATGLKGRLNGYLNQRWPSWLKPRLIDFEPDPRGIFAGYYPLTARGDCWLVPTPGHSPGHLSVLLNDAGLTYFFAGDAAYTEAALRTQTADGIGSDPAAQRETHRRILTYAAQHPTIFLPSHDPEAAGRLHRHQTVPLPESLSIAG